MGENKILPALKEKIKELKYNLQALSIAYRRKDVPVYAKIAIIITVCYALSPIDLIPDFIPVLGYLDDLVLVPLFIFISIKLIPKDIMDECREQAKDLRENGKPKKWYYAMPIIIIWLALIVIIAKNIAEYYA